MKHLNIFKLKYLYILNVVDLLFTSPLSKKRRSIQIVLILLN